MITENVFLSTQAVRMSKELKNHSASATKRHGQILSLGGGDAYGAVSARPLPPSAGRGSGRSHCPALAGLNEFAAQRTGH